MTPIFFSTTQASVPTLVHIFVIARAGPYLMDGSDHYRLGDLSSNVTNASEECEEMNGLDMNHGDAIDTQRVFALTTVPAFCVFSLVPNSCSLVRQHICSYELYLRH